MFGPRQGDVVAAGNYLYVIVGAGSAGCVLANRLSADPACQVALLEAGGPDRKRKIRIPAAITKLFLTEYDWNYRTTKQPQLSDRELYWPAGKTLGGSSSINGQAWTRGHRVDYDGWAQSCPGWSYDEVLPYFQRSEHRVGSNAGGVYGTSGPQFISELRDPNPTRSAFLAACSELGLRRLGELNEPDNTGFAPTAVTQRRGLRHSAADAYLRPVRRRPNLTVITGAHALRILLDGNRATGVEYRDAAGVAQRMNASREVIISAGAVKSPQLLMLSGIGDVDHLRAAGVEPRQELVGVGANLQDHLAAGVVVHCPKPVTLVAADSTAQLVRFLLARRGMLTSSVNEAVAFVRSDPALAAPDLCLASRTAAGRGPDRSTAQRTPPDGETSRRTSARHQAATGGSCSSALNRSWWTGTSGQRSGDGGFKGWSRRGWVGATGAEALPVGRPLNSTSSVSWASRIAAA
jgi:choline dehydrogenase